MRVFQNIPIRRKILISMLAFTLIPILLVAVVALTITYSTMRDQLIYDRRMSIGWLQDRLTLETGNIMDQVYPFEVDKTVKADLNRWCTPGGELDYSARWRIITVMNSTISLDSRLNSIEIFNLQQDCVLVAERSGAALRDTGDGLAFWKERPKDIQTNLIFFRTEKEILAAHQIRRFEDKAPIAVVVFHYRPYQFQHILSQIKTTHADTLLLFNDQGQLIEADYGTDWQMEEAQAEKMRQTLSERESKEAGAEGCFWFYRSVGGGKLQILFSVPNRTIAQALRPTCLTGIAVALVAILASVVCSVLYSQAVTLPIQRLSEEMKSLTLNRFSGCFSEKRRDEIGVLQQSFDIMIARNQELILREYQSKIEKRNAQLRALQAQINPHFLYNTLQVIGGMALKRQAPEIYEMTVALSNILHYSLNFSVEMVPLAEELEYLDSYLLIQNARYGGRIIMEKEIAPETLSCLIPKLILQPLAENSFTHGFVNKTGDWRLCLQSRLEGFNLLIEMSDNGSGISEKRLEEIRQTLLHDTENVMRGRSHIGLSNVHARVRLKCPEDGYGVAIQSTPGKGTTIIVCIKRFMEEEKHV